LAQRCPEWKGSTVSGNESKHFSCEGKRRKGGERGEEGKGREGEGRGGIEETFLLYEALDAKPVTIL